VDYLVAVAAIGGDVSQELARIHDAIIPNVGQTGKKN
jgi:hypothetical protein